MTQHPDHGARVVLQRRSERGSTASYQVVVYAAGGLRYTAQVELGAEGVTQAPWSEPPPEWIETFTDRLLKSTAKKHASSGVWPRKLSRWRDQR